MIIKIEGVEELTTAINALAEALNKRGGEPATEEAPAKKADKTVKTEKAPAKKSEPAPEEDPTADDSAPEEGEDDLLGDDEEITLTDLRGLGRMALKDGKSKDMKAILQKYGAGSLTELDVKHYSVVNSKLKGLLSDD